MRLSPLLARRRLHLTAQPSSFHASFGSRSLLSSQSTPASTTRRMETAATAQTKRSAPTQGELVAKVMMRSPEPLVDIGINLTNDAFHKDLDQVIARAQEANVGAMIVTGTCVRTSRQGQQLCANHPNYPMFFTAGVHPHDAKSCDNQTLSQLRELLSNPRCVAVGECGLDFDRNYSPPDVQEEWFDKQVALAVELKKPLFLHCREAAPKLVEILKRHMPLPAPAVAHCFTGNRQELETFLDLGLHIGITGWVCDDRPERGGAELASILPIIPQDRLMIETDGPYLIPRTIKPSKARPGRNEPALLPHVLQTVAAALGQSEAEVARRTTETAKTVFGLQW